MKIGHFTKTEDGHFEGRIITLNLTADIKFQPVIDKTNEKMPDFRIVSVDTEAECGAGWHEISRNNKPYISVKIDDPAFASPLWAALTRDDNGEFSLYWDRPKPKSTTTETTPAGNALMSGDRTKRIAELNDQLRARVGLPSFGASVLGTIVMTRGICSLPPEIQIDIWFAVNRYDDFKEGDNPYGERDFGCLDIHGAGKIFWKIDYYEDASCEYGAQHPEDPNRAHRVLTIMLAEEY